MKKLLVPVDFTVEAYQALEVAAHMAERIDAAIYLLSISEENQQLEAEKEANDWMNSELFRNVNMANVITAVLSVDGIQEIVKNHDIDAIVIGLQENSLALNNLQVSLQSLIDDFDIPILAIKENDPDFWPKRVVFASTFYGEIDHVFQKFRNLAETFRSELHLVKVITKDHYEHTSDVIHQIEKFAEVNRVSKYKVGVWNHSKISNGILEYADHVYADMITISAHQKNFYDRILDENVPLKLIQASKLPVMCLKIKKVEQPSKGVIFPD